MHRLGITGLLRARLFQEARRLVLGVVQLGETVGDLAAGDEKLEAVGYRRVGVARACERRHVGGIRDDIRRLNELFLGRRLEELQLQHADAIGRQNIDA